MTEPVTIDPGPDPFVETDAEGVTTRTLAEQFTAVSAGTVDLAEIGSWISHAFGRVAAVLAAQRVAPIGPPYARYFPVGDHRFHVEAGFPVARQIDIEAEVGPTTLPAGAALVTVHAGAYDQVSEAYGRIAAWAAEQGIAMGSDPWEVYLTDPLADPDPTSWRTEVNVPVVAS